MTMKLDEFISQTIIQIIDGVVKAQEYARKKNEVGLQAYVNPEIISRTDETRAKAEVSQDVLYPEMIEFDVAVSVSKGDEVTGGIGAFISVATLGVKAQTDTSYSEVSRIKFSVPVVLPIQY